MLYKFNSSIVISTSRKPSQITRRFSQFLKNYFNAVYINRGKSSFSKIINQTVNYERSILLIVTETKGNPSSINVYDLEKDSENPVTSIYVNVSLPQENSKVLTNNNLCIVNKVSELDELFSKLEVLETKDKITSNCIVISEDDDKEFVTANFIDRKGVDTKFKVYIKGFKNF